LPRSSCWKPGSATWVRCTGAVRFPTKAASTVELAPTPPPTPERARRALTRRRGAASAPSRAPWRAAASKLLLEALPQSVDPLTPIALDEDGGVSIPALEVAAAAAAATARAAVAAEEVQRAGGGGRRGKRLRGQQQQQAAGAGAAPAAAAAAKRSRMDEDGVGSGEAGRPAAADPAAAAATGAAGAGALDITALGGAAYAPSS